MKAFAGRVISCGIDNEYTGYITFSARVDPVNYRAYYRINGGSWNTANVAQWVNGPNPDAEGWNLFVDYNGLTGRSNYLATFSRLACYVPWGI